MRMRHASIEARGRVIATIQARKRIAGGMARGIAAAAWLLFLFAACLA
tara:strand:- start:1 stop:144 length:144 start_codon:yes stop_codon:yes gene_type:complete